MSNLPPLRVEEARNFCCCFPCQNREICIYAGGGSNTQHNMYWAYIIYDADGDRTAYEYLPESCLDVADALLFCQEIIDKWDAPLSYEDVRLWRDICEYLNKRRSLVSSELISLRVTGCSHLVGYDRTHRQKLWEKYKIQFITYEKFSQKDQGWALKGNWEDKIDFLEQVYILGRDENTLPRPWLDKWAKKQEAKKYQDLTSALKVIERDLDNICKCHQWTQAGVFDYFQNNTFVLKNLLEHLGSRCREAKSLLSELL